MAASQANPAVPCWIMPHYRVSESLPAELGCFHLVVIDEASQSDLTALPSLLRAQKVLIVGDDKQVSPRRRGPRCGTVISPPVQTSCKHPRESACRWLPDRLAR